MAITRKIQIEPLDNKQHEQLINLCSEFQPYTKVEEVVFLEVIKAVKEFCDYGYYLFIEGEKHRFDTLLIEKSIARIKKRYFFTGIKYANRELTNDQYQKTLNASPTMRWNPFTYKPAERELYMKTVRACRDFMRAKMSKQAEHAFFEKVFVICDALR